MRVVQVNCEPDPLHRAAADLLDAWPTLGAVAGAVRTTGADVTVVQSSHADAVCERDGVAFRFVAELWSGGGRLAASGPMRLPRVVKALKPDVVHINGFGFPFHTRALCAQDAPVLVQHHGDNPRGRLRVLKRWGLAKLSAVAFTSDEQAKPFIANAYFSSATPVFAIPESSTRFRDGDASAARGATGIYGNPAVLWVGHLDENKDPLTVIEGFSRALQDVPEAHLWCCYRNAPLLTRVRARIARDGRLAEHVHLLGPVSHETVEQLCRAADFFMLGSRHESCGYAVIEALGCGATPIVSDIPAFRAITGGGAVGTLCKPGDAQAFGAALVSSAGFPFDILRDRAVSHFRSELSFPVLGRKLAAAYKTVILNHEKRRTNQR
jgi:glycosyltransferase involved in cell wall biosynthesis